MIIDVVFLAGLATSCLALGALLDFALGLRIAARRAACRIAREAMVAFTRGCQAGADALANEYLAEAAQAGDPLEEWPAERRAPGRPS